MPASFYKSKLRVRDTYGVDATNRAKSNVLHSYIDRRVCGDRYLHHRRRRSYGSCLLFEHLGHRMDWAWAGLVGLVGKDTENSDAKVNRQTLYPIG